MNNRKVNKRKHDRVWFVKRLGEEYMSGLTIHHEWEKGDTCFLVTFEQHLTITQEEVKRNENISSV